ncbi:MAG: hypothetical protein J1E02_08325 [Coprobacter sp.]|nr:hypothetical protein [Coprobacter sp.]
MTIRSIQLGGITTGTALETAADGELREALNLRQKQGRYLPVRENRIEFTAGEALLDALPDHTLPDDYQLLYIHHTDNYEHWISYAGGSLWYEVKKEEGRFVPVAQKIADTDRPGNIQSIGNILICILPDDIRYFLFTEEYRPVQEIRSPLNIHFTAEPVYTEGLPALHYRYIKLYDGKGTSEIITNSTPVHSDMYLILDRIRTEGLIPCQCLLRYAYRLYDGSYICQSPPILVIGRFGERSLYLEESHHTKSDHHYWLIHAYAYQINVDIEANEILSRNSDIIQSVDIFLADVSPFDNTDKYSLNRYLERDNGDTTIDRYYTPFAMSQRREKIIQESDFRLVDSIKTTELGQNISRVLHLKGKLTNLSAHDRLPDDEFSHNTFSAQTAFTYNSRLHLGNITTRLFSGFNLNVFNTNQLWYNGVEIPDPQSGATHSRQVTGSYIETHIKTDTGIARVISPASGFKLYGTTAYLSYPDPRAFYMKIVCRLGTSQYVEQEFDLTPSNSLNLAYYVSPDLRPLCTEYSIRTGLLQYPAEQNNIEYKGNKLRVSALDSPFSFPVELTYTVGTGIITGMAAATEALSQGQFGQFPLYIFTTDGIWTLETGTDTVVYARQTPLSRDICSNPDSITPLDSAIVFATVKGLMFLSGSRIIPFSEAIDLAPVSLELPAEAAGSLRVPTHTPAADIPPFAQYLQTARIGYNYPEKEIYITNPDYDHYYACTTGNNHWARRQGRIDTLIDNYPVLYGIDTARHVLNLSAEEGDTRPVTLVTRPLKLSGQNYKRLNRTLLRGLFTGPLQGFLLGSDDGIRFQVVNRIAGTARQRRDLLWGHTVKPYKYYIVALSAQAGADIDINYLDIDFDELPANRLR